MLLRCPLWTSQASVHIHCTVIAWKVVSTGAFSVRVAYTARGRSRDAVMTSFNTICSSWKLISSSQDKSAAVRITALTISGGSKGCTNADGSFSHDPLSFLKNDTSMQGLWRQQWSWYSEQKSFACTLYTMNNRAAWFCINWESTFFF